MPITVENGVKISIIISEIVSKDFKRKHCGVILDIKI